MGAIADHVDMAANCTCPIESPGQCGWGTLPAEMQNIYRVVGGIRSNSALPMECWKND
jgi:hypothetical protein